MACREPSSTLDRAEETEDEDTYDEDDDYVPVSPRKNLKVNRKPRSSSGSPRYDVDDPMSQFQGLTECRKPSSTSLCVEEMEARSTTKTFRVHQVVHVVDGRSSDVDDLMSEFQSFTQSRMGSPNGNLEMCLQPYPDYFSLLIGPYRYRETTINSRVGNITNTTISNPNSNSNNNNLFSCKSYCFMRLEHRG